ncbi:hypothetical protein ACI65C_002899 [Semiaphis heraclei]
MTVTRSKRRRIAKRDCSRYAGTTRHVCDTVVCSVSASGRAVAAACPDGRRQMANDSVRENGISHVHAARSLKKSECDGGGREGSRCR